MKKLIRIILLTVMCIFLTNNLTGLRAEAAEMAAQSGIEIAVSSDRDAYTAAEDAQISFSIRNTNDTDLDGVNWALQLPDGLSAKNGSVSGENLRLRAGESYEGSVIAELALPDAPAAVTDTAEAAPADGTTTAPAVQAGEQPSVIGIFGIIAAAAALAWVARKRNRKLFGILGVLVCTGMIAFSAPVRIFAADEDGISVEAETTVKFDGTSYTVKLLVTADAIQQTTEPGTFYAWAEYSKDSSAITVRWQAQENASVYRVYEKANPEAPLAEITDAAEYVFPVDEATKAKIVFSVEAEIGSSEKALSNDVTVRRNSDGSYTFSDIDSDRDGLDDLEEIRRGTDRLNPDTDRDGLKDGYEAGQGSTDPLSADTDENGTPDGSEDYDGDGIPTQKESLSRANPYSGDTDEDGFPDSYEIENGMDAAIADPIVIDWEKAAALTEYTETDIEALNENEEYPLELFYNDDKFIERINGIYSTEKILNARDALYSLYHIRSLLGMDDPASELTFTNSVMSPWSFSYSFCQVYQGIEAEGRTVTVTCKKDGKITSLYSGYLNKAHFKKLNTKPTVSKQQLKELVNSGSDKSADILSSDLCIRIDPEAVLVYRVVTNTFKTLWIDAHTGKTVHEESNLSLYSGHYAVEARDETGGSQFINVQVQSDNTTDTYFMRYDTYKTGIYEFDDTNVQTSYFNGTSPDVITSGGIPAYNRTIDLTDPNHPFTPSSAGWDGPAVSTYCNFLTVLKRYASKQYRSLDGVGGASPVFVHSDQLFIDNGMDQDGDGVMDYTNACYCVDPYGIGGYDQIHFSDNHDTTYTFGTDQQIIGHEFGHAIVRHKKSQTNAFSTMLLKTANEAYADIFGSWVVNSWPANAKPLRNLQDPNASENPARIGDSFYQKFTSDPHLNSTIISHAAYLLDAKYDYTMDEVFDVYFESASALSDSFTGYASIRNALVAAARAIGYSNEKVYHIYDAFNEVGVPRPTGCAKIIVKEGNVRQENVLVQISDYGNYRSLLTNPQGAAEFSSIQIGTNRVRITPAGREPIYTTIMVREGEQSIRIIDLLTAETDYEWDRYDHYDFEQVYGPTLEQHIEMNETDITMRGYTEVPFKDFLLTHENNSTDSSVHWARKILSFNIDRDEADWHTLEGGGFLFDVTIRDTPVLPNDDTADPDATVDEAAGTEGYLTAHCVLVTSSGLRLFELRDVDIALFRDGKLGRISDVGERLGEYSYDIGDVTAEHSISINIRKGSMETITILDGYDIIVENLEVNRLYGDDYGPITSHDSHCCEQESWFTFSDIQMSNVF